MDFNQLIGTGNTLSTLVSIIVIIAALLLFRKVASCLARIVIFIILMGLLVLVYVYSRNSSEEGNDTYMEIVKE